MRNRLLGELESGFSRYQNHAIRELLSKSERDVLETLRVLDRLCRESLEKVGHRCEQAKQANRLKLGLPFVEVELPR